MFSGHVDKMGMVGAKIDGGISKQGQRLLSARSSESLGGNLTTAVCFDLISVVNCIKRLALYVCQLCIVPERMTKALMRHVPAINIIAL